jgi:hypothetical protein
MDIFRCHFIEDQRVVGALPEAAQAARHSSDQSRLTDVVLVFIPALSRSMPMFLIVPPKPVISRP